MTKISMRVGIKVRLPFNLFPNAAIFVVNLSQSDVQKLMGAFTMIREVLSMGTYGNIADRFVCEVREVKP